MEKKNSIRGLMDEMMRIAHSTNAAKVTVGWETMDNGYLEVIYYTRKPRRK